MPPVLLESTLRHTALKLVRFNFYSIGGSSPYLRKSGRKYLGYPEFGERFFLVTRAGLSRNEHFSDQNESLQTVGDGNIFQHQLGLFFFFLALSLLSSIRFL